MSLKLKEIKLSAGTELKEQAINLGTHSGNMHPDDVVSGAILSLVIKLGIIKQPTTNIHFVRTRNESLLKKCYEIFDVGGGRFDHHNEQLLARRNRVPYASAGLVWKEYGVRFIKKIVNSFDLFPKESVDVYKVFNDVDEKFLLALDAADNGYALPKFESLYFNFIHMMNLNWIQCATIAIETRRQMYAENFVKAVEMAESILINMVINAIAVSAASSIINKAYTDRTDNLLVLPQNVYWNEHVIAYNKKGNNIDFVIYPYDDCWVAKAVPKSSDNPFDVRMCFPNFWAAKEGPELEEITRIPGSLFCHRNCDFFKGTTQETVISACMLATEFSKLDGNIE